MAPFCIRGQKAPLLAVLSFGIPILETSFLTTFCQPGDNPVIGRFDSYAFPPILSPWLSISPYATRNSILLLTAQFYVASLS